MLISSIPGLLILPLIHTHGCVAGAGVHYEQLTEVEKSQAKFTDGSEWDKTQAKTGQEQHSAPQAGPKDKGEGKPKGQ